MTQYFERAEEIRHLSDEQIEEIYKRYLEGEKTSQLMEQFQIPSTVRSLLKVLPPIVSTDLTCPYCELPMWMRRYARELRFRCAVHSNASAVSTSTLSPAPMAATQRATAQNVSRFASSNWPPGQRGTVWSCRPDMARNSLQCLTPIWALCRS